MMRSAVKKRKLEDADGGEEEGVEDIDREYKDEESGEEKPTSGRGRGRGRGKGKGRGRGRGKGKGRGKGGGQKPDVETQTGRSASPPKGREEPQVPPETCRPKKAIKKEPKTEKVKQPKAVPKATKPELPDGSPEAGWDSMSVVLVTYQHISNHMVVMHNSSISYEKICVNCDFKPD